MLLISWKQPDTFSPMPGVRRGGGGRRRKEVKMTRMAAKSEPATAVTAGRTEQPEKKSFCGKPLSRARAALELMRLERQT